MKKLLYLNDIREEINNKFQRDSVSLIEDSSITPEKRERFASELRIFKKYALEMVEELELEEAKDDQ